jgi:hypothetical protein
MMQDTAAHPAPALPNPADGQPKVEPDMPANTDAAGDPNSVPSLGSNTGFTSLSTDLSTDFGAFDGFQFDGMDGMEYDFGSYGLDASSTNAFGSGENFTGADAAFLEEYLNFGPDGGDATADLAKAFES